MVRERTLGVWLIGARGEVAATTIAGAAAIRRKLAQPTGMVSAHDPFAVLPLAPVELIRFGGHDGSGRRLIEVARELERGPLSPALLSEIESDLASTDERIRPAPSRAAGARRFVDQVRKDLEAFRRAEGPSRIVVVNLLAEPAQASWETAAALEAAIDRDENIPESVLYAYAALSANCPYVNFTASTGASLPALAELARTRGVPCAGRDAKRGEMLLKSALAPLFAMRRLEVKDWSGAVAPALADLTTAWDLVTVGGFLGTQMTLQLSWQGSASALAAPLVLDLVRFTDLAAARGESGPLGWLGFYFNTPDGCATRVLHEQYQMLLKHLCA